MLAAREDEFLASNRYSRFFDDFFRFAAADWTITTQGTPTQAVVEGKGGNLLLTNSGASSDRCFLRLPTQQWIFAEGRRLYFSARFKVSSAVNTNLVLGFIPLSQNPLSPTDGIYISTTSASAVVRLISRSPSNSTIFASSRTIVDGEFIKIAFEYPGFGRTIRLYVNDEFIGGVDRSLLTALPMSLCVGMSNGTASAQNMTIDYISAYQERDR